jgi:hypothetical protein
MQRNHAPESGSESRVPHSILTTDPAGERELASRLSRLRGLGGDVPQAGSDSMLHGPGQAEDRELEPCPQHGSNAGLTPEGTVFRMGDVELRAVAGRWVDVECWPLAGIRWHHGDDDLEDWAGECHLETGPAVGPISRDQAESRAWDRYGDRGRVGQLIPGSSPHHYRFRVFRVGATEPEDLERAAAPDQHLDPAGPAAAGDGGCPWEFRDFECGSEPAPGANYLAGEDDDVTAALSADVERLRSELAELQAPVAELRGFRRQSDANRSSLRDLETQVPRLGIRLGDLEAQVHRLRLALLLAWLANTLLVVAIGLAFVWGGGAA